MKPEEINNYINSKIIELNKIYDKIPTMKCKKNCRDCCGATRWLPAEAINITKFLKENNMKEIHAKHYLDYCPYLDENKKCRIYLVRPVICRLFGTAFFNKTIKGISASLICPHKCRPSKYLTPEEADKIMDEVAHLIPINMLNDIGTHLGWEKRTRKVKSKTKSI